MTGKPEHVTERLICLRLSMRDSALPDDCAVSSSVLNQQIQKIHIPSPL